MNKKILIVEDDPGLIKILKLLIEVDSYDVLTASGGDEAFEIVKQQTSEIGFILSDMQMPQGSGIDLLNLCQKNGFKIPILLSSGMSRFTDDQIRELGAIGVIHKPYDVDQILELIKIHAV